LFQFVSLLLPVTVRLSFGLFLFFWIFAIGSFLHLVLSQPITQVEKYTLKSVGVNIVLDIRHISV